MDDYISTLTGQQMDTAMADMAAHISEAWAVGERNGVAVSSVDETYNNNAKYYAQRSGSYATQASSSAEAASTSEDAAAASASAASELIGGVPGLMYLSSTDGHLYMTSLDGFNGSFSITRSTGHLFATFN